MNITPDFHKLFKPNSIAIVGASTDKFKGGGRFLRGFIDDGYKGKLYPVNPGQKRIMGIKCFPSILDIPEKVNLAYIAVPSAAVPDVITQCSQKGVEFAIVHSAGFSELGEEGKNLEKKLIASVSNGKPRIIGPNCMGIYSPAAHINTVVIDRYPDDKSGQVSFIAQSGWVPHNVLQLGHVRGVRFNTAMSIGNQSDITVEDLLEYFTNDDKTRVIAFYIEGLKNGRRFLELARYASKRKPVIVLKGGRSPAGSRAAASHTGSMAGDTVIFDAAMKQSGILVVRNIEELIDLMALFSCPYLPQGEKMGILSESGGGGVAGADAAHEFNIEVPTLSEERQRELFIRLKGVIPPFNLPKNPVDLVWPPMENRVKILVDCAEIILKEMDSLVIMDYAIFTREYLQEIVTLRERVKKPIYLSPCFPAKRQSDMEKMTLKGIPSFSIPERAVKAISKAVEYTKYLKSAGQ